MKQLASGLHFPEGPIAMADGTILVCEIAAGRISRIGEDGTVELVAEPGGGPNGAAFGPDGNLYLCNNGGVFDFTEAAGFTIPGSPPPESWSGGSIQRVDVDTGEVETIYTESQTTDSEGEPVAVPLRAPNDLVFDSHGGFWFTDHGARLERASDRTGIHYATADGSSCREVVFPLDAPNGVGLSPDGTTLYAAETHTGRVWSWQVSGPGEITAMNAAVPGGGTLLAGLAGAQLLDSLAVDSAGYVCVGTIVNGGITTISPDGEHVEHLPLPDPIVTNICFGGPEHRTAYVTLSASGQLVSIDWPRPGLPLAHEH